MNIDDCGHDPVSLPLKGWRLDEEEEAEQLIMDLLHKKGISQSFIVGIVSRETGTVWRS